MQASRLLERRPRNFTSKLIEMAEALSEVKGKGTYRVTRDGDKAREERIEPRLLPGAEG